jgi:hypothetical protein
MSYSIQAWNKGWTVTFEGAVIAKHEADHSRPWACELTNMQMAQLAVEAHKAAKASREA